MTHSIFLKQKHSKSIRCIKKNTNEDKETCLPIETVRLLWGRCETVVEHHRYLCPNLRRDVCPLRPLAKRKRLGGLRLERGGQEHHGVDMGVQHQLVFR